MKKAIFAALLCLPILAGCTAAAAPSLPSRLSPTKETENDILRRYPLERGECRFFVLGEDLLMAAPGELTKYTGKQLLRRASCPLPDTECRVSVSEGGIVCCVPEEKQIVIYDSSLTEIRSLPISDSVQGTPMLCSQGNHLYFCSQSALLCMDVTTGICKTLREGVALGTEVTGIVEDAGVILCTADSRTEYISVMDGSCQEISPPAFSGTRVGSKLCLNVRCGENDCLCLEKNMLPLIPGTHFLTFVPAENAALFFRSADASLILYDLTTGNQIAGIMLESDEMPDQACGMPDGRVFFVQGEALYQWMPEKKPSRDPAVSITALYTMDAPNRKGLEQCRLRASFLEQQYGFRTALNEDLPQVLPAGIQVEPEYITLFIRNALDQAEQGLLRLPAELIRAAVSQNGEITLCILRSITADGENIKSASFQVGSKRYILLAAGEGLADAVLREIYPLIDSRILSSSDALDLWSGDSACNDRAEVLLKAISPNNRELFCDAIWQKKLRCLSQGIREAFPTVREKGQLPWEQYLW